MNQSPKITYLSHSRLLFVPLIGTFLYKLQNYLYGKELINVLYIARKPNPEQERLLKKISTKATYLVCRSYKFGRTLCPLKPIIIADFIAPKNLKFMPLEKIHEVSWTLVLADKVTPKTKKSLGNFLPINFPEVVIN